MKKREIVPFVFFNCSSYVSKLQNSSKAVLKRTSAARSVGIDRIARCKLQINERETSFSVLVFYKCYIGIRISYANARFPQPFLLIYVSVDHGVSSGEKKNSVVGRLQKCDVIRTHCVCARAHARTHAHR